MSFPVFDLHCDTAFALLGADHNSAGSLKQNECHIDLERAKILPGYAQCFACYTTSDMYERLGVSPILMFERELATIQREVDKNSRRIGIAYTPEQIEENRKKGKASAILTLEGTAGIGYDPELLQDLALIGFRMATLTWNECNPLAGSHLTGGGLTDQGREFVKEAQRVGICVDVSHLSDEAFWQVIDMTDAPIVASHSNSRKVWDTSRNLSDDMFRAICRTGGVAGLNVYTDFLGDKPDLDTICDHVLHWLELDPDCRHIALGGDLDGCDRLAEGFDGIQSYPALANRLLQRGLTERNVMDIFWNNAMGVITKCCM
ncbi:MAG: membrane dipeptidase [Oscillospiraceae bacterium]|nr:membrane dipeptidase [Oscillospiraceae bacterium]